MPVTEAHPVLPAAESLSRPTNRPALEVFRSDDETPSAARDWVTLPQVLSSFEFAPAVLGLLHLRG